MSEEKERWCANGTDCAAYPSLGEPAKLSSFASNPSSTCFACQKRGVRRSGRLASAKASARPSDSAAAAMVDVRSIAEKHGHTLGRWYGIGTRLYKRENETIWLTSCMRCERMGWIVHPLTAPLLVERWRPGGPVLEERCEG